LTALSTDIGSGVRAGESTDSGLRLPRFVANLDDDLIADHRWRSRPVPAQAALPIRTTLRWEYAPGLGGSRFTVTVCRGRLPLETLTVFEWRHPVNTRLSHNWHTALNEAFRRTSQRGGAP